MKKKIGILLSLLGISVVIIGCSSSTEANVPSDFQVVEESAVGSTILTTVQKKSTGCFYMFSANKHVNSEGGLVQVFIEKDGVSVPYCE